MTFTVSMRIAAEGDDARAEVQEFRREVKGLGDEARRTGTATREGARGTRELGTASRGAARDADAMAAAERRAADAARELERNQRLAAGQVGNLTAQFNDIGVMLASGQNPLQLALQQGTQITQVIGPMGAAGAVRALGGALLSMLSPLNLLTIGGIALGATAFQWLRPAEEEAVSLEDQLGELTGALDAYRQAAEAARRSTSEMSREFGTASVAARRELEAVEEARRRAAEAEMTAALRGVLGRPARSSSEETTRQMRDVQSTFGLRLSRGLRSGTRDEALAAGQLGLERAVLRANGPEEQLPAMEALLQNTRLLAEERGGISDQEQALIALYSEQALALRDLLGISQELSQEQQGLAGLQRLAYEEYYASRVAGEEAVADAQRRAYELYGSTRAEADAQLATAREIAAELEREAEVQRAIAMFGAESEQVARLRLEAERETYAAMVDALDVSEAMKASMMSTFDAAKGIVGVGMDGTIGLAADEAARLAENMNVSLTIAQHLARQQAAGQFPGQVDGAAGPSSRDTGPSSEILNPVYIPPVRRFSDGRSGRRRGSAASRTERDPVADLIEAQRAELELAREFDPVAQEMIRHRRALADATAAQKDEVRGLIAERMREEQATRQAEEAYGFWSGGLRDMFGEAPRGFERLTDAVGRFSERLYEASLNAVLLGEGPLAGLLGTAGGSGLIGSAIGPAFPGSQAAAGSGGGGFLGGLLGLGANLAMPGAGGLFGFLGFAGGGMVHGPGSGTSDSIYRVSSGEFIANARATQRYRHVLEAMNAGVPAFARGGTMAPMPAGAFGPPQIVIENHSSVPMTGEAEETVGTGGARAYRFTVADEVGAALARPGGGARRAMGATFGLRPKGSRR